jgi:hypothetical protein
MIARLKIVSLVVATMLVGASAAWAQPMGEPAYRTDYYNNAAHQTQVGEIFPIGCFYDDFTEADTVSYRLIGTQTSYPVQELVGYCYQGEYTPV